MGITKEQYEQAANILNVEVAAIKAIDEVESKGEGFQNNGEPKILFEPHVFWRLLKKKGIDPSVYSKNPKYKNIVYEKWGDKPYGKYSEQHDRLKLAVEIDREAALMSASWGRYQIMGFNYSACNKGSIQEFINSMYNSEYSQLLCFIEFIKSKKIDKYLRNKDWKEVALRYNGKGYAVNKYDKKLEAAYNKYK